MKQIFGIILMLLTGQLLAQEIICVNTDPNDANSNIIVWDVPNPTCGPFQSYEIWVSNDPNNAFQLAGTVMIEAQTDFTHVNAFALGDPLYYYIVYNYNCPGNPPIISQIATNEFSSHQPEIVRLEVQAGGIYIEWEVSPYPQTQAYVVNYLLPNGLAIPVDTIYGINSTSTIDTDAIPEDPDLVYTLTLLDGCDAQSAFNPIGYSLVVFDNEPQQDGCEQLISLSWAPYNNPYGVGFTYNVYVAVNDDTLSLTDNVSGTNFNFFDFIDGDSLTFMVEVVDNNGQIRTNSALATAIAQIVQPPREFYIYNLTVGPNNLIQIYFNIDTLAELRNLTINNGFFETDISNRIERFDATVVPGLGNIFRVDSITDPNQSSFYYQVIANDSCNEDYPSTIGKTIWLRANLSDFFENELTFNAFELVNATVTNYAIYRDFGAGFQFVTNVTPGLDEFNFFDDVTAYINQQGSFCYRVDADYVFTFPDSSITSYTSRSNTVCIDQRPSVYIPNAIVPTGVNSEFKPVIVFGGADDYRMQIFSRWGEKIFESTNIDVGWRGDHNGQLVPTGGYAYVINYTALDGTRVEKKGIVSVIR